MDGGEVIGERVGLYRGEFDTVNVGLMDGVVGCSVGEAVGGFTNASPTKGV